MTTPIRQSFALDLFLRDGLTLDDLLAGAAAIGYQAVDVFFPGPERLEEIHRTAQRHGMSISSLCGHRDIVHGLNDPTQHERIRAELRDAIATAERYLIPGLITFSGSREGRSDDEAVEVCAEGLAPLVRLAEDAGVNLNMELLNSRRDHPDYQCDHTAWGRRLCATVGSPRVALLYDIYHMQIMEGDLIETIRSHIGSIAHIHTAGNPGRGLIDQSQEINYPAVCRAIADTDYPGFVAHELRTDLPPLEALGICHRICDVS
jgi:hydroxypyruvate isomerase